MEIFDITAIRAKLQPQMNHASESLCDFNDSSIGLGHYDGCSGWRRNPNGDEILLATDHEILVEQIEGDEIVSEMLAAGSLIVIPKGVWNRLTAEGFMTLLWVSPSADGAEHQEDDPRSSA
tara:strand:- start:219 stop:581 length:363 start_codon:yes stop_codon:yes gene_type:complete